jgi:hypothetical protein
LINDAEDTADTAEMVVARGTRNRLGDADPAGTATALKPPIERNTCGDILAGDPASRLTGDGRESIPANK